MKRLWDCWKNRKRSWRIVCNVLLCVLLVPVLWAELDYPLPIRMQFHRMERANLMPESEVIYEDQEGNVVGLRNNVVVCAQLKGLNPGDWDYRCYELGQDPVPIPLMGPYLAFRDGRGEHNRILIFRAPKNADRVEMKIYTDYIIPYTIRTDSTQRLEGNLFLLNFGFGDGAQIHGSLPWVLHNGNTRYPYRMSFYDGDRLMEVWEDTLPVGVPNKWSYNSPAS